MKLNSGYNFSYNFVKIIANNKCFKHKYSEDMRAQFCLLSDQAKSDLLIICISKKAKSY